MSRSAFCCSRLFLKSTSDQKIVDPSNAEAISSSNVDNFSHDPNSSNNQNQNLALDIHESPENTNDSFENHSSDTQESLLKRSKMSKQVIEMSKVAMDAYSKAQAATVAMRFGISLFGTVEKLQGWIQTNRHRHVR